MKLYLWMRAYINRSTYFGWQMFLAKDAALVWYLDHLISIHIQGFSACLRGCRTWYFAALVYTVFGLKLMKFSWK